MNRIRSATNLLSTHQTLSGISGLVGTVISLIAAIRSEDLWIQIPGILFTIVFGSTFIYVIRHPILATAEYLTWKFLLGHSLRFF